MGADLSTPNFIPRTDGLLLPNEIVCRIAENLCPREILWMRGVAHSWLEFIAHNHGHFVGDSFGIGCTGSEYVLQQLVTPTEFNDDYMPPTFGCFFLENVELTRHPQSLLFWDHYSEHITRLEFTDCAVLPRTLVSGRDASGNVVNFDTKFYLGCPNLKRLALRKMDKAFMMGGEFLQFHQILCLENLESLDLTCNKYLTDRILFDLLLETEKLKSLNLSQCPLILAKAVHNRFYPQWGEDYDTTSHSNGYSNHILSFEKLANDFLRKKKGANMRELILKATSFTSYTANLIVDPAHFSWKSLDVSYCRELKARDIFQLVFAHAKTLKKLSLNSDGRGPDCRNALMQIPLPKLENLSIRNCNFILEDFLFLENIPKLKSLKCPKIVGCPAPGKAEALLSTFSKLTNITKLIVPECAGLVEDNFLQMVIQSMRALRKLNVSGCEKLTDRGFTGISADELLPGENTSLANVLPFWLLSQGVSCRCQNHAHKHEPQMDLENSIILQEFPRMLDQEEFKRRQAGFCLSELKYLEELDVSYCPKLTSTTWHFGLQLKHLFRLNLTGCETLSLNSMGVICMNCPCLEYLEALRCTQLLAQPQFQDYLKRTLKRLRRFVV